MTDQWKQPPGPGPWMAGVKVRGLYGATATIIHPDGAGFSIDARLLYPLPAALTPEQQVVIEVAEKWRKRTISQPGIRNAEELSLVDAVDALHASRKPKDPVAEVRAAAEDVASEFSDHDPKVIRLRAAIAALEKKERGE